MNLCRYNASGRLVCSIPETKFGPNRIIVFQNATPQQQYQTAYHLMHIFPGDFESQGIKTTQDLIAFILDHWKHGDSFYIFVSQQGNVFGGVGVDISNNEPFLSNLFVIPPMRSRGFSKVLIKYAEDYASKMEYPYIKIWCENKLINFYKKIGYEYVESTKDSKGNPVYIMNKPLNTGGGNTQSRSQGLTAYSQPDFGGFGGFGGFSDFGGGNTGTGGCGLEDQYQLITRF